MYVYKELKVLVISDDGWSWALAWRQLWVLIVSCYPLAELASKQILELSRHVPDLINAQGLDSQTRIVSVHICSFTDLLREFLTNLEHPLSQCIILSVIRQSSISVTTELT
jgi:lipopolysaccharide biosynthesis protein